MRVHGGAYYRVQVSDLEYVFHAFVPPQGPMPRITHMTRGRMRRQAFVQYRY